MVLAQGVKQFLEIIMSEFMVIALIFAIILQ